MATIQNLKAVTLKLKGLAAKARKDSDAVVAVGYTAAYAIYVHENIEMKWRGLPRDRSVRVDSGANVREKGTTVFTGYNASKKKGLFWGPNGQAKFLEQPARTMNKELGNIIAVALKAKKTMAQALLLAGLRLQRESQKLVPVDTGNLRASAFTRLEAKG